MKLRIKDHVAGRSIKKLLLTCILIMSIIFIAGCIGEEKTNTETSVDSQSNQQSDDQVPDLILKPNDVPKLVSRQPYNVVKYISYVPHIQLDGIKYEEIHRDAYY